MVTKVSTHPMYFDLECCKLGDSAKKNYALYNETAKGAFICDLKRFREEIAQKIFAQSFNNESIRDGGRIIDVIDEFDRMPQKLYYDDIPSPFKELDAVFTEVVPKGPKVIPAIVASYLSFAPINRKFRLEYEDPHAIYHLFHRAVHYKPGDNFNFQRRMFEQWVSEKGVSYCDRFVDDIPKTYTYKPQLILQFLLEMNFLEKPPSAFSSGSSNSFYFSIAASVFCIFRCGKRYLA